MNTKTNPTEIVTKRVERIKKDLFKTNPSLKNKIMKCVEDKSGVYVLYKKSGKPYYIGRSKNLSRRIETHLNNRHFSKWDSVSFYVTKKSKYDRDIEALVLTISKNKGDPLVFNGNTQFPKPGHKVNLTAFLKKEHEREDRKRKKQDEQEIRDLKKIQSSKNIKSEDKNQQNAQRVLQWRKKNPEKDRAIRDRYKEKMRKIR